MEGSTSETGEGAKDRRVRKGRDNPSSDMLQILLKLYNINTSLIKLIEK